jgi:N-acetylmuramoyl-L-alanine amidase
MAVVEQPTSGSPHFSLRTQPISAIIIHDTASYTAQSALNWFANPTSRVSAHVVIDRDGTIFRVVLDSRVAWHAGISTLHGIAGCNGYSLGVELVDAVDGEDIYPAPQWRAAVEWCAEAVRRYRIPLNRIVGHCHVSPGRKIDPGTDFPWYDFLLAIAIRVL